EGRSRGVTVALVKMPSRSGSPQAVLDWENAGNKPRTPTNSKAATRFIITRSMPALPDEIEEYRDARWQREGAGHIETAAQAERFIESVGFSSCLTDSRKPGPSLYVAVCGRRDAVMPRDGQKDHDALPTH